MTPKVEGAYEPGGMAAHRLEHTFDRHEHAGHAAECQRGGKKRGHLAVVDLVIAPHDLDRIGR